MIGTMTVGMVPTNSIAVRTVQTFYFIEKVHLDDLFVR